MTLMQEIDGDDLIVTLDTTMEVLEAMPEYEG